MEWPFSLLAERDENGVQVNEPGEQIPSNTNGPCDHSQVYNALNTPWRRFNCSYRPVKIPKRRSQLTAHESYKYYDHVDYCRWMFSWSALHEFTMMDVLIQVLRPSFPPVLPANSCPPPCKLLRAHSTRTTLPYHLRQYRRSYWDPIHTTSSILLCPSPCTPRCRSCCAGGKGW